MKIIIEHGDTSAQRKMAEALFANGLVTIETVTAQQNCIVKSDDEIRHAVTETLKYFGVKAQWTAIYRILVDFCGWDSEITKFVRRMKELMKDVRMDYPINYQAIQKTMLTPILQKHFTEWKRYKVPQGDRVFNRQMFIAKKMLELLQINA